MESNTTPNLEVAKTESKGPSLASIDRSSLSVNASAGPIAQDVTDLSGLFYNFNVVLKHYNDVLRRTVKEHPGLTRKQQSLNMKVLTSVEQALNANMNSLRINPSAFGLTIISARLGSIKESLLVVSGRLDAEEINTDNLSLALGRLAWRQARHVLLASMYSTPTLAEVYEQISIREMVWALAPEIKVPERDREGEEWPEQLRYIEGDAICPICHLMLTEDVSFPLLIVVISCGAAISLPCGCDYMLTYHHS